jgi:tetratricopeptide (TPR) repeat protein
MNSAGFAGSGTARQFQKRYQEVYEEYGDLCEWGGDRASDSGATRGICRLVGRLPLAVRLAGKYLDETGESAAEYLAWLRETPIEALSHGEHREESVRVLLEKSLEQVSDAARQVLAVVGLLALAPFSREPIAAALDMPPSRLRRPLGELVSYGLLLRGEARYEVSHALVHTYARECCVAPDEVIGRLAAYYDALALEQRELGLEGYRRLDAERAHMMRVLRACAERARWEEVRSLVWAVDDYLRTCGYWTEQVDALETGVEATRALDHRHDEGAFRGNLGLAYSDLGQMERAIEHYQQALAISREIGDRRGEAFTCWNLGLLYEESEPARAVELMSICVAYEREIGHPHAEADAERVAEIAARIEDGKGATG